MGKSRVLPLLAILSFVVASCSNTSSFSSGFFSSELIFSSGSDSFSSDDSSSSPSSSKHSYDHYIAPEYHFEDPDKCLYAKGAQSYVKTTPEQKTKIVASLEKWATEQHLTGLTLYENGTYYLFNDRVIRGSGDYLTNYGFGVLSNGELTSDLESETNPNWKRYYHDFLADNPTSINYFNDSYGTLKPLISLTNLSYYKQTINSYRSGYNWSRSLSRLHRPTPMNLDDATNKATIFRVPVKIGSDVKYATLSSNKTISAFNGREVSLEDYLTPFKILYTQAYSHNWVLMNVTGNGSIKGALDYYNASKEGFNIDAWNNVGIRTLVEANENYLEFEFNYPCTTFEALTYLNNYAYSPIPEDFIKALGNGNFDVGVSLYGGFTNNDGLTPVDTLLSTGPYMIEKWDKNQQIVLKKNPLYSIDKEYSIEGVCFQIKNPAASLSDQEYAFNQFKNGKLDWAEVPKDKVKDYLSDDRLVLVSGDSVAKLNMNTCTSDRWQELFGENGSICQTPLNQYWEVEPAMSNDNFLNGLSYALDRENLAKANNATPTSNFFPSAFMGDPESGTSYNMTGEHIAAVKSIQEDTKYGFSMQKAQNSFLVASQELIAQGAYKAGDIIEIEIAWQTNDQTSKLFNPIKAMLEEAFNTNENPLKLNVASWVGQEWSDVYYEKMMRGQFDIGFGSISGGAYHYYERLECLRSDNDRGFTINWGADTSIADGTITYDKKKWSYDALLEALERGVCTSNGESICVYDIRKCEVALQNDGSLSIYVYTAFYGESGKIWVSLKTISLYAMGEKDNAETYSEINVDLYKEDGGQNDCVTFDYTLNCLVITISAEEMTDWFNRYPQDTVYAQGIDAYFEVTICGIVTQEHLFDIWKGTIEKRP